MGDKMDKVGIPRSLFYYYYKDIWKVFFDELNISYILSPPTNIDIMEKGMNISNDEMCLSLKNYLGHIDYLKDKCEYVLIPRICNFKRNNQTCTNFWAIYDIVNNLFDIKILNYNIDLSKHETLKKGLYKIGRKLNRKPKEIRKAYKKAIYKYELIRKKDIEANINKLNTKKTKILIVSHPYIICDNFISKDIIKYLKKQNIEIIFSFDFDTKQTNKLSKKLSKNLYFKYSKDSIGSIVYSMNKIDGIIFVSAFPCAPDSLVNELVMRKIKKPYINLILDNNFSFTALETRLESFIDVLRGNIYV